MLLLPASVFIVLAFAPQQDAEPEYYRRFNHALELIAQQKDAEAIAEFEKTLELSPGLYEAQINLGTLLLRNGRPAEALPFLKQAAAARPAELLPVLYCAQALFDTGDFAAAEPLFAAALTLAPSEQQAHLGLARILARRSDLAAAAAHYQSGGAALELAAEYEKVAKLAEAAAIYRQFPDRPEVAARLAEIERINTLALADSFRDSRQLDKAAEQLRAALAKDPGNFELQMGLARTLRDQKLYPAAAQEFLTAARLKPDSISVWNELAAIFVINKRFPEALTALDKARALGPETAGQLYFRALSLDSLKQRQPAVDAYRSFLGASNGKLPDEEFLARQRVRIIEREIKK